MSVLKTCPYCGGHGYINQFEYVEGGCRAWANECIAYKGTGAILVPETNADRIRRMSDEELAEELVIEIEGLFPSLVYVPMATGNIYISRDKAEKEMLEYLQQSAEEES